MYRIINDNAVVPVIDIVTDPLSNVTLSDEPLLIVNITRSIFAVGDSANTLRLRTGFSALSYRETISVFLSIRIGFYPMLARTIADLCLIPLLKEFLNLLILTEM